MEYDIADVVGRIWIWLIIGLLFCEVIEGAGTRSYLVSGSSSKSHIEIPPPFDTRVSSSILTFKCARNLGFPSAQLQD